ncbi:N-acetylmuramoyl-L-alanine amidase [Nocardiopsis sediminis]|uniref:N-acetylmuramoyl-L-alanine amidase n=1 Tax=Nocardiopsis sediminis TaxID=1778267 RepID=A0ABV8FMR7_9ACTN
MIDIVSRAAWGARPPLERTPVPLSERTEFMVHHSETPTTETVKQIQDVHMDERGWSDIGYNFLIDSNGRIYEGRGWTTQGAHCPNHNRSAIGACVIGTYFTVLPSAKALASLQALYAEANHQTGRTLTRMGHRDGRDTDCPGDALYAWVHSTLGHDAPGPPPPQPPGADTLEWP